MGFSALNVLSRPEFLLVGRITPLFFLTSLIGVYWVCSTMLIYHKGLTVGGPVPWAIYKADIVENPPIAVPMDKSPCIQQK